MTSRRDILIALAAGALAAPLAAFAQPQGKFWRVGYMNPRTAMEPLDEAFRKGMGELGYVDGQNIVFEWRFAKGHAELYPQFAAEFVRLKVDCIVTAGLDTTRAAMQATKNIPIVMANANDDPVRLGMIASLARPGGNVTGFINIGSELAGKRLEFVKAALPKAARVAILADQGSLPAAGHVMETEKAARALGMKLQTLRVSKPEELENAFRSAVKEHTAAIVVVGTGIINSHRARIAELAVKTRVPVIYTSSQFVTAGGLMSFGADQIEQYRGAANYVDRILKGTKPADLPVAQPTKFEFVVNLKAARQIGLTLPPEVIARAEKVLE